MPHVTRERARLRQSVATPLSLITSDKPSPAPPRLSSPLRLLAYAASQVNIRKVLTLGRIQFLIYSPIAFGLGWTCATVGAPSPWTAPAKWWPALWLLLHGQLFISLTQLMTHYFNEYEDLEADKAHKFPSPWTGGSRMLVKGEFAPRSSLYMGLGLGAVNVLLALSFPNMLARIVGLVIVALSHGYSCAPLKLAYRGLGEADVTVVLNLLVPLLGWSLLRTDRTSLAALCCCLPSAVVEYVRMMVMNMADVVGDALARKRTLVVRIGLRRAALAHTTGIVAAYTLLATLWAVSLISTASLAFQLLTLPPALLLCRAIYWRHAYLHVDSFYAVPYWASQHNAAILSAALLAEVWHNRASAPWAWQLLRCAPVLHFMLQVGLRAWQASGEVGGLERVFNPRMSEAMLARQGSIERWENALHEAEDGEGADAHQEWAG